MTQVKLQSEMFGKTRYGVVKSNTKILGIKPTSEPQLEREQGFLYIERHKGEKSLYTLAPKINCCPIFGRKLV